MKKRLFSILGFALLIQTFFFGAVDAAYLQEFDKYIVIETKGELPEKFPLSDETAQLMFEKQEAFISQLEQQTGRDLDHYYIWVVINGVKVLAIDPPVWGA